MQMSDHQFSDRLLHRLIGNSESIKETKKMIQRVAPTDARVLITGETGTGKTMIAKIIHLLHPERKKYPFCRTNIGALVSTIAHSQLSGHVAFAFTGAARKSDGIILESHNGTLFLDEIATAHPGIQVLLLDLLEIPEIDPVGGGLKDRKKVNIRIISATTHSPHELMNLDTFRKELFFRISECIIELKPLRERKDDIEMLANHFIVANNPKIRCPASASDQLKELKGIEPEALDFLKTHDWPGNVRELEHVIRSAMVESRMDAKATLLKKEWIRFPDYCKGRPCSYKKEHRTYPILEDSENVLSCWDIACSKESNGYNRIELKEHVDRFRSVICNQVLSENNYNRSLTAKMLGIDAGSLMKYKRVENPATDKSECSDKLFRIYIVKK